MLDLDILLYSIVVGSQCLLLLSIHTVLAISTRQVQSTTKHVLFSCDDISMTYDDNGPLLFS